MNDWKIRTRSTKCQACSVVFSNGQVYHTLLVDERHEYHRIDVCQGCWNGQYGHGTSDCKGFVSHWQAKFMLPPPPPPEPIQRETAELALRKLTDLNDRAYRPACFILSAMLERKRMLKVREQITNKDVRTFVYEHVKTGDVFTIHDPNLKLNELEDIQRDVAKLLESGVDEFLNSRDVDKEDRGARRDRIRSSEPGAGSS
ncbi:MAG: hypothetical protein M2R45_00302 [Verrucomicrobia subdivision 3 bacterium]|nr:hypothetical protein [Limisphaerales bacterium]MCS1412939.1 hypothetical protein [Limisphaerales bacterium]